MRLCTVPDCGRPYLARGYCSTHYRQWKRTGSPFPKTRAGCYEPGCDRPHLARGLCNTHYDRQRFRRNAERQDSQRV